MPKYSFLKYGIEIRPNEHNHKGQMAHIHIYIHGEEVGSMFLNGELRDGKLKSKDMKIVRQYILENADQLHPAMNTKIVHIKNSSKKQVRDGLFFCCVKEF